MENTSLIVHAGGKRIGRQELLALDTPVSASASHTIIPHAEVVERVAESLAYRKINILKDEYAIANKGARMFGTMTLDIQDQGVNLVLGLRNSHDKSFSLGLIAGFRVFVCDNLAFHGSFTAIATKHSKNMLAELSDKIAIGVDRTQRHFQPMLDQINVWKDHDLTDGEAKSVIYRAFVMGELDAPERLAPDVHQEYFNPRHEEFAPRNLWSLQNAFTEVFKKLDPMPQLKALQSLNDLIQV